MGNIYGYISCNKSYGESEYIYINIRKCCDGSIQLL